MSIGVTRTLLLTLFVLSLGASSAKAQSATYHLHKDASTTTGLFQLKTAGPDATTLAIQTVNLKNLAAGEYIIKLGAVHRSRERWDWFAVQPCSVLLADTATFHQRRSYRVCRWRRQFIWLRPQ